jgi:hypothetical protein
MQNREWRYIGTDSELLEAIEEAFNHWVSKHSRDIPYGLGEAGKQSIKSYMKKHFTVADV